MKAQRKLEIEKLAYFMVWAFANEFGSVYKADTDEEYYSDNVESTENEYGFDLEERKYLQKMCAKVADLLHDNMSDIPVKIIDRINNKS